MAVIPVPGHAQGSDPGGGGGGGTPGGGTPGLPTWEDVGFWAADVGLNSAQNLANNKLLEKYKDIFQILRVAYAGINTLTDDNRKLHERFFEQLADVNPVVSEYFKVYDVIKQLREVFTKAERDRFRDALRQSGAFEPAEIEAFTAVLDELFVQALEHLGEIRAVAIAGAGDFEMMDSERIAVVDRVHASVTGLIAEYRHLRDFAIALAQTRRPGAGNDIRAIYATAP